MKPHTLSREEQLIRNKVNRRSGMSRDNTKGEVALQQFSWSLYIYHCILLHVSVQLIQSCSFHTSSPLML